MVIEMETVKLIIELQGFDAVTFYNIVNQLKDRVEGQTASWTKEYRDVLKKVLPQLGKQLGFD